jgi:hypothetical protein
MGEPSSSFVFLSLNGGFVSCLSLASTPDFQLPRDLVPRIYSLVVRIGNQVSNATLIHAE